MRPLHRVDRLLLPAAAYKTYAIDSPRDTTVVAACRQVGCAAWWRGWESLIDESTELGRRQAAYIRHESGRSFREWRTDQPGVVIFRFEAFQRCFTEHRTRPELFTVRGGDWRGNPSGEVYRHTRPADWVDDFAQNLDRVRTAQERG